ncbi:MAG: hypothetical protein QOI81_2366 [Actinomycetota bacterium]|jgi:hypothetical protein|nr:hypothetical protein [Actinomycetota bacterium]
MTAERASSSYYFAAAALVIAIASFFVLAGLVIHSPQRLSLFQVDAPTTAACPRYSEADACYAVQVHNTGNAPGYVQCAVSPAAGTSALFHSSGLPNVEGTGGYQPSNTYSSSQQIQPGQGLILVLEVKSSKGSRTAQPTAGCLSVPAPAGFG